MFDVFLDKLIVIMKLSVVLLVLSLICCFFSFYLGIRVLKWKNLMLGMGPISSSHGSFLTINIGTSLDSL